MYPASTMPCLWNRLLIEICCFYFFCFRHLWCFASSEPSVSDFWYKDKNELWPYSTRESFSCLQWRLRHELMRFIKGHYQCFPPHYITLIIVKLIAHCQMSNINVMPPIEDMSLINPADVSSREEANFLIALLMSSLSIHISVFQIKVK